MRDNKCVYYDYNVEFRSDIIYYYSDWWYYTSFNSKKNRSSFQVYKKSGEDLENECASVHALIVKITCIG